MSFRWMEGSSSWYSDLDVDLLFLSKSLSFVQFVDYMWFFFFFQGLKYATEVECFFQFFFPICRYYSVSLSIGNPPKLFELDIDTGSDLTWVQCDAPCTGCTKVNVLDKNYNTSNRFSSWLYLLYLHMLINAASWSPLQAKKQSSALYWSLMQRHPLWRKLSVRVF